MKKKSKNIYVTKTFMPPIEDYQEYLNKIWVADKITNQGPMLKELEFKLSNYLNVENFHFVNNGTIALQLALKSLNITEGEIITTPFSYVATTSSILWERCEPVFVDIEPKTFCIDASKIEKAITKKTKAIMAVHVFGFPCDVEKIKDIAERNNLKVIYDGAHAFGADYKGESLLSYGDISTCSFHATKIFHTIEGGCVILKDKKNSEKLELIKRFGHHDYNHYFLGTNAKASEFHAAMGLCNLKYFKKIVRKRKIIFDLYDKLLGDMVQKTGAIKDLKQNYSYYPVVFRSEKKLLKAVKMLNEKNVYPKRYFYPSLNLLPYLNKKQVCPISEDIAKRILCLPLYADLEQDDIEVICKIINSI